MSAYRTLVGWVVETLKADAQLLTAVGGRIYDGTAPATAEYPFVTVSRYTNEIDTNYGALRSHTLVDVLVRVWDRTPASQGSTATRIDPIADRVDELLTLDRPVIRGSDSIRWCVRVNGAGQDPEVRESVISRCEGGRYQAAVSKA